MKTRFGSPEKFCIHDPNSPQSWFDKADNDLASAKIIFTKSSVIRDTVCFHCQQAVEKYLKGYLVHLGTTFKLTHDLEYLARLIALSEAVPPEYLTLAVKLEDYGVFGRYPKMITLPTDQELQAIFLEIEDLRKFYHSKIFP